MLALAAAAGLAAAGQRPARAPDIFFAPTRQTVVEGDLFTTSIAPATVVTLYLSESLNLDLEPKLRNELRKGSRIVSHQFRMGRWQPDETRVVEGEELFLWVVP